MTRVQLVFMVKWLFAKGCERIRIYYAEPEHYNTKGDKHSRFAKACFTPVPIPFLTQRRPVFESVKRVAVVLLGHEGQRTLCAWNRVDAGETVVIFPRSGADRMDLCRRHNEFLLSQVSGEDVLSCEYLGLEQAKTIIECRFGRYAENRNVRISLVPLGPKPILVGVILGLLSVSGLDCDLMYPVPASYNAEYSSGVRGIFWADIDLKDLVSDGQILETANA
jgi:hypothetical protein